MVYSPEYVVDRLRNAEQIEIRDGEESYMGDLAQLLDEDAISNGLEINFGPNKEVLTKVLEALNIETHLGRDLNIYAGYAATLNAARCLGGKSAGELVGKYGLLQALDLLQIGQWEVQHYYDLYPFIVPGTGAQKVLTSSIILLDTQPNIDNDNHGCYLDKNNLAIMVSAAHRYVPDASDCTGRSLEFAYRLKEIHKKPNSDDINQIGDMIAKSTGLELPGAQYILKLGHINGGRFIGQLHDIETRHGKYVYRSGHIERDFVASGDDYDQELATLTDHDNHNPI